MYCIQQPNSTRYVELENQKIFCSNNYLVESEAIRTYPGVLYIVLAVMEDFTVKLFVGIVTGLFADAIEFGLL